MIRWAIEIKIGQQKHRNDRNAAGKSATQTIVVQYTVHSTMWNLQKCKSMNLNKNTYTYTHTNILLLSWIFFFKNQWIYNQLEEIHRSQRKSNRNENNKKMKRNSQTIEQFRCSIIWMCCHECHRLVVDFSSIVTVAICQTLVELYTSTNIFFSPSVYYYQINACHFFWSSLKSILHKIDAELFLPQWIQFCLFFWEERENPPIGELVMISAWFVRFWLKF